MSELTNEQIASLIANVSGFENLSEHETCEVEAWWLQGAHEALKEILALRERVERLEQGVKSCVDIIDEELLPNVGKMVIQDFMRLNETLIKCRQLAQLPKGS